MRQWNVRVRRQGRSIYLGQVAESTESLARCAALSRYGLSDDEAEATRRQPRGASIYPDEEFDVSPAS